MHRKNAKVERQIYASHQVQSYRSNHVESSHPVHMREKERSRKILERNKKEVKIDVVSLTHNFRNSSLQALSSRREAVDDFFGVPYTWPVTLFYPPSRIPGSKNVSYSPLLRSEDREKKNMRRNFSYIAFAMRT